jgi:hypothetical protein
MLTERLGKGDEIILSESSQKREATKMLLSGLRPEKPFVDSLEQGERASERAMIFLLDERSEQTDQSTQKADRGESEFCLSSRSLFHLELVRGRNAQQPFACHRENA